MSAPRQPAALGHRALLSLLALVVLPVLLTACGPRAELTLRQPTAPPAQQNLKLTSQTAYWTAAGGHDVCVLTFPLPGAEGGPRAFVVYLSVPAGPSERAVDPASLSGARGFLIQEVGALAGRADFVRGRLSLRSVFLKPRERTLELDVQTSDGAQLRGKATLEDVPYQVRVIERQYAADVAELLERTAASTSDGEIKADSPPADQVEPADEDK